MQKSYTIGQLATEANVPSSTIRYYERRNLLHANSRSRGNYRLYDDNTLERIRFIRSAQEAGFTLGDIESLLRYRDNNDGDPCFNVQDLITARLNQVREKLEHLATVEGLLTEWLNVCTTVCKDGKCGVLAGLNASKSKK